MRKHDVRKWLHAILDLLPVILIPVFMIYSHRHTIDSGFIDVPQNQVVDFNQLVINDNISRQVDNIDVSSTYYLFSNTYFDVDTNNDVYLVRINPNFSNVPNANPLTHINVYNVVEGNYVNASMTQYSGYQCYRFSSTYEPFFIQLFVFSSSNITGSLSWNRFNIFNLTQMFGSGNEPTIDEFNIWYSNNYYDYTLSRKELLKGTSTITFDDTDIMSQVVYQLYNSVDKYFNMGNVFNMTGVYDWFNLNIFNGNAPISIYIVWNIVLYEFVMDLLFLLYGLFMWFIDMVEKLMEKPLKSVK